MSAIERTRKLIALTGSANEHEAKNAAVQACKLIREHGFELVDPKERRVDPTTVVGANTYRQAASDLNDLFRNMSNIAKGARATVKDIRDLGNEIPMPGPPRSKYRAPSKGELRRGTAKIEATCVDCGTPIEPGDEVWFRSGKGGVHAFTCNPDKLNR